MPVLIPERSCVRCGKPQSLADAPFCSRGCRDRDLLDWFGERHVVPGPALDNADDEG